MLQLFKKTIFASRMKTIEDFNFKGKKVCVRVDFNVPFDADYNITDDNRIRKAIPTIQKIMADGGAVILMSHLGRPKGKPSEKYSLKHILKHLSQLLKKPVKFADDAISIETKKMADTLQAGEILLLENLRFYEQEMQGDIDFAAKLASLGDFYVNDAFGAAHRAHASTAIMAKFFDNQKCFGYLMESELANAQKILLNPIHPMTAIIGGAKVSDKILIIDHLLDFADNIIIGGGMAYTFIKALGGSIGNSLCEDERLELTLEILAKAAKKGVKILLPKDSIIADKYSADANTLLSDSNNIPPNWMGLDIGPVAQKDCANLLAESKTILWNGPMGVFEMKSFAQGTKAVADAVVSATEKGSFSLIGGGDSAAAIAKFNYTNRVSYVSTGGGALLKYFEGKTLPGVAAITG